MPNLVLYDGVCGLCNRSVLFLVKRDRRDQLRFASLQGGLAREVLLRHGRVADNLDTFYYIVNYDTPEERLFSRGRAALKVLQTLGGVLNLARLFAFLPDALLDFGYNFIAKRRFSWFGRHDTCPIPEPKFRAKFLE